MSDDIDALAGTRRRAIVGKALRQRQPDRPLQDLFGDARAVLDALDEDFDEEPYEMTVEQQIRRDALASAAVLLADDVDSIVRAMQDSDPKSDLVDLWLICASAGAGFIADATIGERQLTVTLDETHNGPGAEPTPPLDGDGVADGTA